MTSLILFLRFIFLIAIFFFTSSLSSQETIPIIEKKIDELMMKMTLKEKIGQLIQYADVRNTSEDMIIKGQVSSFFNVYEAKEVNRLQKIAVEKSRLKIPLIFGNDVIHGFNTTFPIPLGETASWNPKLIEEASRIAAYEAASHGTHWTFTPMVDVSRDPRWGRIAEGSGEDPYLGSVMAKARIKGLQGKDLKHQTSIAACAKHYVAYGGAEAGRDYNSVDISKRTLREIYLPPFKSSVDSGVATIMSAFNDLNGIPASANYFTLTQILRNEWKFDGFVVSDYNSIGELVNHGIAADKSEAALLSLSAGVDMDMVGDLATGNVYAPYLEKLVKEKLLSEKLIDRSVRRILRIKYRLGLFERPYVDLEYFQKNKMEKEYKDRVALELARESIVLLKNENKVLPLKQDVRSIALIGPLADDKENLLGPWNTKPILENVISVRQGLQNALPQQTKLHYTKGCDIQCNDTTEFDKAIELAEKSQVVILVVGEAKYMSGEAASKTNIGLPGYQKKLIKKIHKTGKPLVVVLMNGRPITLNWVANNVDAILETWFLGDQTGNAIAQVLLGKYNPSGKLPITFPRNVGQIPIYYNHRNTGRPLAEDKYTTKYLDSPNSPLFPFGFGLSYTQFQYKKLEVNPKKAKKGEKIKVSFEVSNTGDVAGQEVVQLYIKDEIANVTRPVKELKGFRKIFLKPKETKIVQFLISPDMLTHYDRNFNLVDGFGHHKIMIGGNSQELIDSSFEILYPKGKKPKQMLKVGQSNL